MDSEREVDMKNLNKILVTDKTRNGEFGNNTPVEER